MSQPNKPTLAIVGASGAVGSVMRQIISERADLWGKIRLIASRRSAGKYLPVRGENVEVQLLQPQVFDDVDIALFDVPDEVSAEWAPIAAARGSVVIDNSGAFRMDNEVPLVVPEVNPEAAKNRPKGIIANPNCTTLGMIVPLSVLHKQYGLREVVAASYQAVSGSGHAGVETLHDQIAKVAGDRSLGTRSGDLRSAIGEPSFGPFAAPVALNVVPWAGSLKEDGWSSEELKVRRESRKILALPDLRVTATCVRVPVVTAHSLALHAVFAEEVYIPEAQQLLRNAPTIVVEDDPGTETFPTPADAVGTDPTWVGRMRQNLDDPQAVEMFVCSDNLRKGAALNTAQIAELLVEKAWL